MAGIVRYHVQGNESVTPIENHNGQHQQCDPYLKEITPQKIVARKACWERCTSSSSKSGIDRDTSSRTHVPAMPADICQDPCGFGFITPFISALRAFFARLSLTPTLLSEMPSTSAISG